MQPNLKYSSQHYLSQWINDERGLYERLRSDDSSQILAALGDAVKYFQVARNLPTKFDLGQGQERYEPLLQEFRKLPRKSVAGNDFVVRVDQFQRSIGAHYGGRNLISLASKLLWLRYRDPFIIYDSRVRNALGATSEDYREYTRKWLEGFDVFSSGIASACNSLPRVLDYLFAEPTGIEEDVVAITSKQWFHRRVFDIYLWHEGG